MNGKVLHKQRAIQQYFSWFKPQNLGKPLSAKRPLLVSTRPEPGPSRAAVPAQQEGWSPDIVPHPQGLGSQSQAPCSDPLRHGRQGQVPRDGPLLLLWLPQTAGGAQLRTLCS